ncbi:MAG: RNase adapter RapZ [Clostridia bacterium]|nr:RNase adapter RapZ [Clostridia bacterium]
MELLIVTGMSGSGKSAVTDALEDLGYFCADNMPPALIPTIAQFVNSSENLTKKTAVVTDIRIGESWVNDFLAMLVKLKDLSYEYKILFVDASDDVLIRRYKETRRKHPLIDDCDGSLIHSVQHERELLLPIKAIADYVLDTTSSTAAECKRRINEMFLENPDNALKIRCMSFGFKYGIPNDSDIVFDVRCLPNPFYIPSMKYKTGLDKEVNDYVLQSEQSRTVLDKLNDLISYMIPLYVDEGKSQLVISIGCTGGKHRSVCFAEHIAQKLKEQNYPVSVKHRDIEK